ncbi:MAG: lactonase family protein [Paenibacillaceae bacterium]
MKNPSQQRVFAYIGSYTEPTSPGVYVCSYDSVTGTLALTGSVEGLKNPTFLDIDETALRLYALSEGMDAESHRYGEVTAYTIDPESGQLQCLNKEQTVASPICHITLDHTHRCIMVSSYHGGMVGLNPILEDGRIGPLADVHQHTGSSILPIQNQSRAHSISVDRLNRYALACDLGLDRIIIYRLDAQGQKLIPHNETTVAPGSGPRHWKFHPSLPYGYVINELNATITAFSYDEEQGQVTTMQTVPTLPATYNGENACADIHISPDGRFLYGSNRGHDSIVVYAIDPANGSLRFVEHALTMGQHPRGFAISPDGHFLLVANRDTHDVVTFLRDANSGKLIPSGDKLSIPKPVCIKFLTLG